MDQKIKKQWVDALCSGQYEQCKGGLRNFKSDGSVLYCCLGVLQAEIRDESSNLLLGWLDEKTLARIGMNHEQEKGLADLNDEGVPFEMIAGLIDEAL